MNTLRNDFVCRFEGGTACLQGIDFSWATTALEKTGSDTDEGDYITEGAYTPVDLTGYTAKMQVRQNPGEPVIVELSTTNGRITLGGTDGTIQLHIAAADTAGLPPGMYKYDLDLIDSNGVVSRYMQGAFEIVEDITV